MGLISHLLNTTITVASASGLNDFGKPTYDAQRTVQAWGPRVDSIAVSDDDNTAVPSHTFYVEEAIYDTDRIWPPWANTSDVNEAVRSTNIWSADFPDGRSGYWRVKI